MAGDIYDAMTSADVVYLDAHRPHFVGHGKCHACRHEVVAVGPCPVEDRYECSKCGGMSVEIFPTVEAARAAMRVVPKLQLVRR